MATSEKDMQRRHRAAKQLEQAAGNLAGQFPNELLSALLDLASFVRFREAGNAIRAATSMRKVSEQLVETFHDVVDPFNAKPAGDDRLTRYLTESDEALAR